MKNKIQKTIIIGLIMVFLLVAQILAQEPTRVGTTAANFLEIGYGAAGSSMGDAYVSVANDLSSAYWNPAGLAFMQKNEAMFVYQPFVADINISYAAVGVNLSSMGSFAMSLINVSYGDMEVTTLEMQEGTGEIFSANDLAFSLSYARSLTNWFSFGATAKYISSKIWHTSANAIATDLGVIINTNFFSPTGNRINGMKIGMSISNYGTRMQYNGIDLLNPIDIKPDEAGNYGDVPGQFRTEKWELPLIFRIGVSVSPLVLGPHEIILAADALHPNNNSESINTGIQYSWTTPGKVKLFVRGGYKALFMVKSESGFSAGAGFTMFMLHNTGIKMEYAFRDVGVLGNVNSVGISFLF